MHVDYLTDEQLAGFKNYKYNAIDTSPLSRYICHPFWNTVVKFVPKWITPNVLTFAGFLICVSNYLMLGWFDFHFYASSKTAVDYRPIPSWVWILCAFFQFLSHTLDGIDGKQARRTGLSGPLGELFDHGLDSWVTLFLSSACISMFGRLDFCISMHRIFFVVLAVHFGFLLSHFEKYNTGILFLPWSYDISQVTMTFTYLITFFCGYQVWKAHVPLTSLNPGNVLEITVYSGGFLLSLPLAFYNIYMSYYNETGKMHSTYEMLRPLISTLCLFFFSTLWMLVSPSDILSLQPRIFFFMIGTIFSNILCRLIISQMSDTRCELINWSLLPLAAITTSLLFPFAAFMEKAMLYAFTILVTIAHIHFGICIVKQMSTFFNVTVFMPKKPQTD